jgi:hypothetical protein
MAILYSWSKGSPKNKHSILETEITLSGFLMLYNLELVSIFKIFPELSNLVKAPPVIPGDA